MLPKTQLGQTDLWVTQLGYGSMGLRGPNTWGVRVVNEVAAEKMLHQVLDAGINFIDTAPDYGISEERIGRYLESRRNEYFIATKCGCDYVQHADHIEIRHTWDADTIKRNLETSLRRLRTDHVDLLQFHGGDAETLVSRGLIDLVKEYQRQGIVRYVGMSNKLPLLPALIALQAFDTFQVPYSCLAPEHEDVIAQAAAGGAGIIVRGGIAHGGPDAEIKRPELNDIWAKAQLNEVLPSSMSRAELILRYTLSMPHGDTTIVGTCNADHLASNVQACLAGPLPLELQDEIKTRVARARNDTHLKTENQV